MPSRPTGSTTRAAGARSGRRAACTRGRCSPFARGLIGLEPLVELLRHPDRDQLRQELDDAGLTPDIDALTATDRDALDQLLEEMAPGR